MTKKPLQLGRPSPIPASPDQAVLDRVRNPHPDTNYVARFTFPEFTVMCPVTGQPDFATLVIDYVPKAWLVESKSLKLYLNSFRNHGAFHEECTVAIGKKLAASAEAEMAAHRRLFPSARRHADRCVLAGGQAADWCLGARPGRQHLSRARIDALQRGDQRADLNARIGRAHHAAHHRDAGAARGDDFGDPHAC